MRILVVMSLAALALTFAVCKKAAGPPPDEEEVEKAVAQPNAVILDVRSTGEFADGHVQDAVNVPVGEVERVAEILPEKDQQIIVHCAAGVRSAKAKSQLEKMGYTKILDLQTPEAVAKATGKPLVN